ncbi:SURF1 family protein [Azospirillum sp. sgz302134]
MTAAAAPRRFRPSLWAVLITVPAVLAMLALGTWQMQRLHWKEELIHKVEQRLHAAPVPLPAVLPDPADFEFRPVTVAGRFLNDKELRIVARPHQGQVGYEVLTPLERADGGGVVLVNRGFVPMDKRDMDRRDPATRPDSRVEGPVTVTGLVRLPQPAGWLQPDNRPGADAWMRLDPPAMGASVGLGRVAPVVVEALPDPARSGILLNGIRPQVELPNNHLQYAITWYSLAATLAVIFVLSQRRRVDRSE